MSSDVQRLVRKLQPKGPRSFDEQVWPIYVAIVVLFGYLTGVIVSLLRFSDPRIHANATTWLLVLSVITAVGIFCVRFLEHRLLKRTIVLSLLLSLIANVSLLIAFAFTSILYRPWQENETKVAVRDQHEEVIVPEYPLFDEDPRQRVPQEYERPVETGELQAEKRIELTRQTTALDVRQDEETRSPQMPSPSQQQHATQKPERADIPSAPHQSQSMAKLSRQELQTQLSVNNSARLPNSNAGNPNTPQSPQPRDVAARPSQSEVTPARTPAQTPTEWSAEPANEQVEIASLTRREQPTEDTVRTSSLPTLQRNLRQPTALPSTSTPVDTQMSLAEQTERDAQPSSTLVDQQRTTSAPETMTSVDLQPKVAVDLQRQTRIDRPESTTLNPTSERATLARTSQTSTNVESPEVPTEAPQREATPDATNVAQQSVRQPADTAATMAEANPTDTPTISPSTLARASAESQTSVSETLADTRSPSRSRSLASTATLPQTEVDGAVAADSNLLNPAPEPTPSRMALSQSSMGVAGMGTASNLDRGVAAPESPVSIASASAHRAESQQDQADAFALSPSSRALSRQMQATANQPRTSMIAQQIESAMVPGAMVPAEAAASSAATVEQAPSNAAQASVTAAKGTTEVDLGPTRIATDTGDGRAEGGGQPEINNGELPRALARSNSIAGASGLKTATDANAAPAAQDLASAADTTGQLAQAAAAEVARAAATTGSRPTGEGHASQAPGSQVDVQQLADAGGSRADQEEDFAAQPIAPGGNTRTGRRARGLQIKTSTQSNVPALASADASTGSTRGDPLDAQGTRPRQAATGLPGPPRDDFGAAEAELVMDGDPAMRDEPLFARQDGGSPAEDGPSSLTSTQRGTPKRNRRTQIAGGSTQVELDPEEFAVNTPGTHQDDSLSAATLEGSDASLTQQGGGAIAVEIEADDGLGGLGSEAAPDVGILARSASPESDFVSVQPTRFLRRTRPSASIASSTDVVTPTKAFRRRIVRQGEALAGERGLPSPKTEAAIELGLVFLSKYQSTDGSWSFNHFADGKATLPNDEQALIVSDCAATGLSLLSFLGAGYHHKDDKYQQHVQGGLDFLVQHQRDDGDLYIDQDPNSSRSAWLYSHAIATIALCEAYGMTQDPKLRRPAQKAVNFIEESQHPTRGGWRYSPAYGSDTSVTGWMTMALKSGELAGLTVNPESFERIQHWMDLAQASESQPFLFRYNPYAADTPRQRHGRTPTRAMTAVGLLMRLYTGWRRDQSDMLLGARTLSQNLPSVGTVDSPKRDTYYWYYATQVMFHMGGEHWQRWNQALHPMLTTSQLQEGPLAGSWDPQAPIPDRWGAYGGRLYVTTLNLLSLEVFYRHLPIYEDTSK